jgi:predicted secreted hydrolase
MRRRSLLVTGALGFSLGASGVAAAPPTMSALPRRTLAFPRDHGAHPELRTEWWYVTGHARSGAGAGAREFGFQVTFFRSRVDATQGMGSAFAAKQLIFAHAAVTDVQGRKLWHDQRIARQGFGVAEASLSDGAMKLRDWSLARSPADNAWQARVNGGDFALDLRFEPTQPLLLQGDQGLSRKGPEPAQASYYYSLPQLATQGRLTVKGQRFDVTGQAWLDHEWSEALLHPDAVGWDWIGMNLFDGSALTAFRLRGKAGQTLWDGGSFRAPAGNVYAFSRGEVTFSPQRMWKSPLSQATYPVEWIVRTPADFYTVRPVLDSQELDSRASTGAIYWEGLCDLFDSNGRPAGRGYLEMTGYAQPLRL